MSENAVKAYQGKTFTITLRASSGTNYNWCLTTLPEAVALASLNTVSPGTQDGAPVDRVFTFLALNEGNVQIGFKLLCRSNPDTSTEEVFFDVCIIPHNAKSGLKGFIRYSENSASYIVPPYGYNGNPDYIVKYGFPGCDDGAQCRLEYGVYGYQPQFKYGYPGCDDGVQCRQDYGVFGCQPQVKYGFPGCDDGAQARGYYGYFGCQPPVLKAYSYPGCDDGAQARSYYGYFGCQPQVTYGYPGCDVSAAPLYAVCDHPSSRPLVLKAYSYPGCDDGVQARSYYGYPGCPVKYGFPGCV